MKFKKYWTITQKEKTRAYLIAFEAEELIVE